MITIDYLESCFALSCIQLTVVRIFDKELAGTSLKGLVRSDVKKGVVLGSANHKMDSSPLPTQLC